MKSKFSKALKLIAFLGIMAIAYYFTSNMGLCVDDTAQSLPSKAPLAQSVTRFLYAMGGVILSSLLIFGALKVYNKFIIKPVKLATTEEDDELKTPSSVNDAIIFFINKNKIK